MNALTTPGEAPEETMEEFESGCRDSANEGMREEESRWKQRGVCFSWIDCEPEWVGRSEWETFLYPEFEVNNPCKRIMRFALIGGGQMRTTEHFTALSSFPDDVLCLKTDLKVIAHTQDGVVIVFGEKDRVVYEMGAEAVVLRGKHQDIAARAATTFRAMDFKPENFFALLDGSEGCAICGRALRDEISKLISVGPECARKYKIPHSRKAAEERLKLRRQLLQECA